MPFITQPSTITSTNQLGDNVVAQADIADDAVGLPELKAGTAGAIIGFNSSGDPAEVTPGTSGKYLMSNGAGAAPTYETVSNDWIQLGETVLGSDAASISVASFAARKDLRIVLWASGHSVDATLQLRFNSDSGSNYGYRVFDNGTFAAAVSAAAQIDPTAAAGSDTGPSLLDMVITNPSGAHRKPGFFSWLRTGATPATAPGHYVFGVCVWGNTAAQITTVAITRSSGNFLASTRLTVYGKKD